MNTKDKGETAISGNTILLDIVSRWPATEAVFRRYDEKAGVCLCCTCLFDTIEDVASRFSLDLKAFIHDIEKAAAG
jgi:hypothetical protein